MTDPTGVIRYIQFIIVKGRKLDIDDESAAMEGETNSIMVDRNKLIETGFPKISGLADLRTTLGN